MGACGCWPRLYKEVAYAAAGGVGKGKGKGKGSGSLIRRFPFARVLNLRLFRSHPSGNEPKGHSATTSRCAPCGLLTALAASGVAVPQRDPFHQL